MVIPLGFLKAAGARIVAWVLGTASNSLIYVGGTYANLANGKWFGFARSSATYTYSLDGSTWSAGTLPVTTGQSIAVAASATRIVIHAGLSGTNTGYYSDNGTTWTNISAMAVSGTASTTGHGLHDGTRFIFVLSTTNGEYSTNGTSWSTLFGVSSQNAIGYNAGTYITVASTATGRICTSDPTVSGNWTNITLPATATWSSIVYANGLWIAAQAGTSAYATSPDGTTWTARTLPSLFSELTTDLAKMVVLNNVVYYYYTDNVYYSTNGTSWTTVALTAGQTLDQVCGWASDGSTTFGFGYDTLSAGTSTIIKGV